MALENYDLEKYEKAIKKESYEEGYQDGQEKGICQLIKALQKFSITQENVLQTLQEKYDLSEEKAEEYIKQTGALYHVALPSETTDSSIVPIGRSELEYTPFYSFLGCYCHKPYEQYTFLIDENGDIYKCGFGAWKYANIKEYISGGFNKKFKEFNKKFYDIFVPSCRHCLMCCKEKDRVKTD